MAKYCKTCYKEKVNAEAKDEDLTYYADEEVCECCGEVRHLVMEESHVDPPEESIVIEPAPEDIMTIAECQVETLKHIDQVRKYIRFMTDKLTTRGVEHDASKLTSPEVELFAKYTKLLSGLTFGSDEYNASLEALQPALDHHFACTKHHPEHYQNGVSDMTLIDIVEMLCDWKAASERQNDGNLLKSIETNAARFKINGQLKQILINTARMLDEHELK